MHILFRAIITGFGLRLGSEIAKTISSKVKGEDGQPEDPAEAAAEDEDLGSVTPDPPQV